MAERNEARKQKTDYETGDNAEFSRRKKKFVKKRRGRGPPGKIISPAAFNLSAGGRFVAATADFDKTTPLSSCSLHGRLFTTATAIPVTGKPTTLKYYRGGRKRSRVRDEREFARALKVPRGVPELIRYGPFNPRGSSSPRTTAGRLITAHSASLCR